MRHKLPPHVPRLDRWRFERTYTDEKSENIDPPPFGFEGKQYIFYEATQKQRQIDNGLAVLHSHTNAKPFSVKDFEWQLDSKVDKIGVIGYNHDEFVCYIGYGDRPSIEEFLSAKRMLEIEANNTVVELLGVFDWTMEGGRIDG